MANLILNERLVIQKAIINELYIPKRFKDKTKLDQTLAPVVPLALVNGEISKIEEDKI